MTVQEFLDKYDEFLEDGHYEGGGNNRIKPKVSTRDKVVSKKPKQHKSRAEKLAGTIEQKKEECSKLEAQLKKVSDI